MGGLLFLVQLRRERTEGGGNIMRKTAIIVMALSLALLVGESAAVEVTLLGPTKFVRNTASTVYTGTFPGRNGTGHLTVKNGSDSGANRVSAATIVINGK